MPTVLQKGPYRFYFYSSDVHEPPHIHVERDNCTAKFWLQGVQLEVSRGFTGVELRRLDRFVNREQDYLMEKWNDYFAD